MEGFNIEIMIAIMAWIILLSIRLIVIIRKKKMKLTLNKLRELNACKEGLDWYKEQNTTDLFEIIDELIKHDLLEWVNWLLPRMMKYKQYVLYAVYAAEQVIDIFEAKYPDDKRPRLAIESAKKCIKNPTKENKITAVAAAYASYAAAYAAAYAADAAATAAYRSAVAAADASYAAAYAADAAADAAYRSAYAAAGKKVKSKIINYGIKLLKGEIR